MSFCPHFSLNLITACVGEKIIDLFKRYLHSLNMAPVIDALHLLFFHPLDKLKKEIILQSSAIRSSVFRWSGTSEGRWEKKTFPEIKIFCICFFVADIRLAFLLKDGFSSFHFHLYPLHLLLKVDYHKSTLTGQMSWEMGLVSRPMTFTKSSRTQRTLH